MSKTARRALPFAVLLAVGVLAGATLAGAEVRHVTIESRVDLLGGRPFGAAGAYEKLTGVVDFAFDPANRANRRIVDLERAPRNAAGLVEARATFMVVRPKRVARPGVALVEVSNRGGKAALPYFNGADWSHDPTSEAELGDGLLMRLGLTIVWVGWQFDVPREPGLLRLEAPVARDGDRPIEGLVRCDFTVDRAVRTLALGHRGHVPYPLADPDHRDNVLTVRDGRLAPRTVVERRDWRFGSEVNGRVVEDPGHITMARGFEAGKLYELVYRARDPVVSGLGLAAIRDVIAYAKHDPQSLFPARLGVAFGVSQTGRFLRHFLYQGFNTDERGHQAFDGMLVHTAGAGRGSFNHRFAQPSRDAHRYSSFFYPTDLFPFTSRPQRDAETGREDGLAARPLDPTHWPRVFYTNTGYEYWGRAASLIHTSVDARRDVEPLPSERIYHLASAQHFVGPFPPPPGSRLPGAPAFRGNPLDFLPTLRALLVRLVEWVAAGREPPPSRYPRLDAGTLVPIERVRLPRIPGIALPRVVHQAHRLDFGPGWPEGVITVEPPRVGTPFPALVPQVDPLGNELGGVRGVELLAPLATYTPWNLRTGYPASADELVDFLGTWVPLPRTAADAARTGDARSAIPDRYASRVSYLEAARAAARSLVAEGFLLAEDTDRVVDHAARQWDWLMAAERDPVR